MKQIVAYQSEDGSIYTQKSHALRRDAFVMLDRAFNKCSSELYSNTNIVEICSALTNNTYPQFLTKLIDALEFIRDNKVEMNNWKE